MSDANSSAQVQPPVPDSNQNAGKESSPPEKKESNPYAGTKHRVKVDNQELEVPYEQLVSDYQERAASQKRFKEAARLRKEVDEFVGSLKSGDLKRLKELGVPQDKIRQFAEAELTEFIQYEQLTEEQKEHLKDKQERDELKREKDARDEGDRKSELAKVEFEAHHELDLEIGQAIRELKADLGIKPEVPVEPWFVDHIARLMIAHLETDESETAEKMPAKLASQRAWKGVENTVRGYLSSVPPDKALAILPPSLRDAIRKADVGDAVTQMHQRVRDKQPEEVQRKRAPKDSYDDWFARKEKQFGR